MRKTSFVAALGLGMAFAASGASAQDVSGMWTASGGKARVRIADCGGGLCANVVSLTEPNDTDGKPKVDKNNADAGKRARKIVGIALLSGMKPNGDKAWKGSIYNPEDGKTYTAHMTLEGSSLKVQGCALGGLICKTQVWTR